MNFEILYNTQSNLICISAVLLAFICWRINRRGSSYLDKVTTALFSLTIIICVSDIFAIIFAKRSDIVGIRHILYIANSIYFIALMLVGAVWLLFIVVFLNFLNRKPNRAIIPIFATAGLFIATMVLNVFTGHFFSISYEGVYSRGNWIASHWIFTLAYLFIAEVFIVQAFRNEESPSRRSELKKYLFFPIIPCVIAIPQFCVYGLSTVQIGITLSVIFLLIIQMEKAAAIDPLTGLNNRQAMDRYIESLIKRESVQLTIFLIDIDNFKYINDNLGHLTGDKIISEVAAAIKHSGSKIKSRIFISRYGGDEFIIIGTGMTVGEIETVKYTVNSNIRSCGERLSLPYPMSVSIGCATGNADNIQDVTILINRADSAMYEDKKKKSKDFII